MMESTQCCSGFRTPGVKGTQAECPASWSRSWVRGKVRSYPVCTMPSHKQIGIEKERVDLLPKGTDEINGQRLEHRRSGGFLLPANGTVGLISGRPGKEGRPNLTTLVEAGVMVTSSRRTAVAASDSGVDRCSSRRRARGR